MFAAKLGEDLVERTSEFAALNLVASFFDRSQQLRIVDLEALFVIQRQVRHLPILPRPTPGQVTSGAGGGWRARG